MKISEEQVGILKDLLVGAPSADTQKALQNGDVVGMANILSSMGKGDITAPQMQALLMACNLDKDGRTELAVNLLGDVVVKEAPRIIAWIVRCFQKVRGSK